MRETPASHELEAAIIARAFQRENDTQRTLSQEDARFLAARFSMHLRDVEEAALSLEVVPRRYVRNLLTFSIAEQRRLLRSRVLLVGLGGLGGCLLEQLARAGTGEILAFDSDAFEESNLNRQLLCTTATLNQAKARAARERATLVNPGVVTLCQALALDSPAMRERCRQVDLVLDALGGVAGRGALRLAAMEAGAPLLSAAVAGWTAYVAAIPPGGTGPDEFFKKGAQGSEDTLGIPAPTVHLAASLQAAWALRLLSAQLPLPNRTIIQILDLAEGSIELVEL